MNNKKLLNAIEGLAHYVAGSDKLLADKVLLEYIIRLEVIYYENLVSSERRKQFSKGRK